MTVKHLDREYGIDIGNSDLYGRLKISELFRFMQEGAALHAHKLGVGMEAMKGRNVTFVLVRVSIRVGEMPSIGQNLSLRTFPVGMNRSFFIRDFEMKIDGCECATARTCWLVIDLDTRRPVKKDNPALEAAPFLKGKDPVEVPEKPAAKELGEKLREVEIGYSHLDILKHVNNTRYLEWVSDCMGSSFFRDGGGYSITVNFSSELKEGDKVDIYKNSGILTGVNDSGKECFTAKVERTAEDV